MIAERTSMTGKSIGLIIPVILLLASCFPAQEPLPLSLQKDQSSQNRYLEAFIPNLMTKGHVPGLSIALIRNGNISWYKGFGMKSVKTKEPVDAFTIFEAASLTKPVFAYAVMRLVEEGILDLETPLINYVPKEKIEMGIGHSLDYPGFRRNWAEQINARMVLSHSSGLPHGERDKPFPIFFKPGTRYKYSAVGYYYLQLALEELKGEKLEVIINKYLLEPLNMKNSSVVWKKGFEETSANGHDKYGKPKDFRKRKEAHSAASLYTTVVDYARFVCAVIDGTGLKQETLKEMLSPQIDVNKGKGLSWSLGFGLKKDNNGKAFWQWGDYGIFRNYIIAYPKERFGVVYLTNSYYGLSICQEIVSKTIGGKAIGVSFLGY